MASTVDAMVGAEIVVEERAECPDLVGSGADCPEVVGRGPTTPFLPELEALMYALPLALLLPSFRHHR